MKVDHQTIMSYENFDALTKDVIELAQAVFPNKVIYINFLNEEIQVTMKVSKHDTLVNVKEGITIPVDNAICHQIDYEKGEPLVLNQTKDHNFGKAVDQTIKSLNIGSYLGVPIKYKDGGRFGTLCAAHHDRSEFEPKDIALLESIAKLFSYYLELEHIAYKDALTNLNNKRFLELKRNELLNTSGLLVLLDLDNFKCVNDQFGHYIGDEVLKEVGAKLDNFIKSFKNAYTIRLGGDEFVIFIKDDLTDLEVQRMLDSLINLLTKWETPIGDINLSTSMGALKLTPKQFSDTMDIFKTIDALLYQAKNNGKNNYVLKK